MTWLLLWVLGLASTWLVYPIQWAVDPAVEILEQHQQYIEDEMLRNHIAEQQAIIIDDYFLFLDKIGKIKYARWCMGEYTPPVRSEEKQKRVKCSDNAFDCAGLVKAYGIAKGIITQDEARRYSSQSLMSLATKKHATLAQRWDWTSRQWFGDRATWSLSTHFAMISRDYTGGNTLRVYDNVNGPNNNKLGERALHVAVVGDKFYYLGKYRISVYTNWFVEEAKKRWVTVESRYDTDPKEETIDPNNPLWFSITIDWFDYDSIANRVASYRYDNNEDKDDAISMIGTMLRENGWFNTNSVSPTRDYWLCQLQYNSTNKIRIDDPRWKTYEFQMEVCLDKWKAVEDKNIRAAYKYRNKYIHKIHLL